MNEKGMESRKRKEEQKHLVPTKKVKQDTPVPTKRPSEGKDGVKVNPRPTDDIIDVTGKETGLEIHSPDAKIPKKEAQRRASEVKVARKTQVQSKLQFQSRPQLTPKEQASSKTQTQQAQANSQQSTPERGTERATLKNQIRLSPRSPDEKMKQLKLPQIEINSPDKTEEKAKTDTQSKPQPKSVESEKKDKATQPKSHPETKAQKIKVQSKEKQALDEKQKSQQQKTSKTKAKQEQKDDEKSKTGDQSKPQESQEETSKQDNQLKTQQKTKASLPIPPPKKPHSVDKGSTKAASEDGKENKKLPPVTDLAQLGDEDDLQDTEPERPHLNDGMFNYIVESLGMLKKHEIGNPDGKEPLMLDETSTGNAFEQYMKKNANDAQAPQNLPDTTHTAQNGILGEQNLASANNQIAGTQVHGNAQQQLPNAPNSGIGSHTNNPQTNNKTLTKEQSNQTQQRQPTANSLPSNPVQKWGLKPIQNAGTNPKEVCIDLTNPKYQANKIASKPQTTLNEAQTSSPKTSTDPRPIIPRLTNPNIVKVPGSDSPGSVQQIRNLNPGSNNGNFVPGKQSPVGTKKPLQQVPVPIAGRNPTSVLAPTYQNTYVIKQQANPQYVNPGSQGVPGVAHVIQTQVPAPCPINFQGAAPAGVPGHMLYNQQPSIITFNPNAQRDLMAQQVQMLSKQRLQQGKMIQVPQPQQQHHSNRQKLQQFNQAYNQTLQQMQQMQMQQNQQIVYGQSQQSGYIQQQQLQPNKVQMNLTNLFPAQHQIPGAQVQQPNFKQQQQPQQQLQPKLQQPQQIKPVNGPIVPVSVPVYPTSNPPPLPQIAQIPQQNKQQPRQANADKTAQPQASSGIQGTEQSNNLPQQPSTIAPKKEDGSGNREGGSTDGKKYQGKSIYILMTRSCPEGESHNIFFLCYPEVSELSIENRSIKFKKVGEFIKEPQKIVIIIATPIHSLILIFIFIENVYV